MVLPEDTAWNTVDVSLPEPTTEGNHYDNEDADGEELEDQGGAAGIFLGLEVIQNYRIDGQRFIVDAKTNPKKEKTTDQDKKKKKKKRSQQDKETPQTRQAESTASTHAIIEETGIQIQQNWMSAAGVELPLEICQRMKGFEHPTPIQRSVLQPAIFGRRNILGAAPTGSGKTLAFLLPVVYDLGNNDNEDDILALIITPTRELAKQIYQQAKILTDSPVACLTGGLAKVKQERVLSQHPRIVTGTPGRLWDLINTHLLHVSNVKFLILDEADRLTHVRSFPELKLIFQKISSPQQTFVFSATLMLPGMTDAKEILELAQAKGESKTIDLSTSQQNEQSKQVLPEGLKLLQINCTQKHKDSHLYGFLLTNAQNNCLVFCNSISGVRRVGRTLQTLGVAVKQLHANMAQVRIDTNIARGISWGGAKSFVMYA